MPTVTGDNFYINKHTLQFRTGETGVASIVYDKTDESISIANAGTGQISIGDAGGDIYIGDGTIETDIIFEQNGAIRALTNKTLKLGQGDSDVKVEAQNFFVTGDAGFSGAVTINGNTVLTGASGAEGDTLQSVTDRGATTTNHIQIDNSAGIKLERSSFDAYAQLYPAYSNVPTLMGRGAGGLHLGYESNISGIRINTNNKVGIGTTDPAAFLTVGGGNSTPSLGGGTMLTVDMTQGAGNYASMAILAGNAGRSSLFFGDSDAEQRGAFDYRHADDSLSISTAASEVMRIDGGVRIGSTSKKGIGGNELFTISGGGASIPSQTWTNAHSSALYLRNYNNANGEWQLQPYNGGNGGVIQLAPYGGNVTIGNLTASAKLDIKTDNGNSIRCESSTGSFFTVQHGGKVGIQTNNPQYALHIDNNGNVNPANVLIDSTTIADASISFSHNGTFGFTIGTDESDSKKFKISSGDALGTNDRFTIDVQGNVGIGTTTPASPLSVVGSARIDGSAGDGVLTIANSAGSQSLRFDQNSIRTTTNNNLTFLTNGNSNSLVLEQANNRVGIGTASPAQKLHIHDGHLRLNDTYKIEWGGSDARIDGSHSSDYLRFFTSNTERIRIVDGGNVGIGTTDPDHTLHVEASAGSAKITSTAGGPNLYLQGAAGNLSRIRWNSASGSFAIRDDSAGSSHDRLTVNSDGDLDVVGDVTAARFLQDTTVGNTFYAAGFTRSSSSLTSPDIYDQNGNGLVLGGTSTEGSLVVKAGGNVGIGTTDPKTILDIDGAANHGIRLGTNNALIGEGGTTGTQLIFWNGTSAYYGRSATPFTHTVSNHFFRVGGNDIAMIGSAGVGIGTTDPATQLQVTTNNSTSAITIHRDGSNPSTNTSLGKIQFAQDYNSTQQNSWGQIELMTNASSVRTDMRFKVKSTSGNELTAMTLHGTAHDDPSVGIGIAVPTSKLHVYGGDNTGLFGSIRNDSTNRMNMKVAMGSTTRYIGTVTQYGNGDSAGFTIRIYDGAEKVFRIVRVVVVNSGGTNVPRATIEGGGEDTDIHINLGHKNRDGDATKTDFFLIPTSKSFSQYVEIEGYIFRDTGWNTTSLTTFSLDDYLALNILDAVNGSRVGVGTTDPSAKLHAEGSMIVKGDAGWAGTDNQAGALFMNTNGRGLLGAFSTSYARPLIRANSNYIEVGSAGTSLIYGSKIYAGSASSSVGTHNFYTSGTNLRMHIAKDGNVGIGTTDPDGKLHIETAASSQTASTQADELIVENSTHGGISILTPDASRAHLYFNQGAFLRWQNSLFTIDTSNSAHHLALKAGGGNVGIGTTDPLVPLHVQGAALAGYVAGDVNADTMMVVENDDNARLAIVAGSISDVLFGDASDQDVGRIRYNHSSDSMAFFTDGVEAARIDSSRRVGIGTDSILGMLQVNGRALVEGPTVPSTITISDSGDATKALRLGYEPTWDAGSISASDFGAGWKDIVIAPYGGNVGIGTTDPPQKLSVKGGITHTNSSNIQIVTMTNSSDHGRLIVNQAAGVTRVLLNSNGDSYFNGGDVGIGTTNPAHELDVVGTYRISDNTTNSNNKLHRMLGRHYTNSEEDVNIFSSISTSSTNFISFGGGSSSFNQATTIAFYTSNNNTSPWNGTSSAKERMRVDNQGRVGIGTESPSYTLEVIGDIVGSSKSFLIDHPTQSGKKLMHSCLEGPEHGVYFRGKSQDSGIQAPEYWSGLVHIDSMTVDVTPIGPSQSIYVDRIEDNGDVYVGANTDEPLNYFYVIYGERKDIDKLEIVKDK
mgnify:CR=1 FL=1